MSVWDPGFAWGGGGSQPMILSIFAEKNCMKNKKFWLSPLDPALYVVLAFDKGLN